jgi:hypothetical protein
MVRNRFERPSLCRRGIPVDLDSREIADSANSVDWAAWLAERAARSSVRINLQLPRRNCSCTIDLRALPFLRPHEERAHCAAQLGDALSSVGCHTHARRGTTATVSAAQQPEQHGLLVACRGEFVTNARRFFRDNVSKLIAGDRAFGLSGSNAFTATGD